MRQSDYDILLNLTSYSSVEENGEWRLYHIIYIMYKDRILPLARCPVNFGCTLVPHRSYLR